MMEESQDSNCNVLAPGLAVFATKLTCGSKAAMMNKIKPLFLRYSHLGERKINALVPHGGRQCNVLVKSLGPGVREPVSQNSEINFTKIL